MMQLVLKRASASRPFDQWRNDYDVLCDGAVVGRIVHAGAGAPEGRSWLWSLAYGYHRDRTSSYGYEPTRETAMAAFAKSWWRE
jgi:hypothetical protein